MKAFITGSTGFLGTHIVQELSHLGWEIIALHRKKSDLTNLKSIPDIKLCCGDITDIDSLREGIPQNIDCVFHLAGSVGTLPQHLEKTRYKINVDGTRNVVQVCKEKNAKKLYMLRQL